jgi:hypothetical protein
MPRKCSSDYRDIRDCSCPSFAGLDTSMETTFCCGGTSRYDRSLGRHTSRRNINKFFLMIFDPQVLVSYDLLTRADRTVVEHCDGQQRSLLTKRGLRYFKPRTSLPGHDSLLCSVDSQSSKHRLLSFSRFPPYVIDALLPPTP